MNVPVLIDTSGFYALLVKEDAAHPKAAAILRRAALDKQRFVTTDYVLDETVTLLQARGLGHIVSKFFDVVFSSQACSVVWMDQERFIKARGFLLRHLDQAWSFTDCSSFVIMKELKLTAALTKDRHFQQAGFIPLL